jgi:hypothetical protein
MSREAELTELAQRLDGIRLMLYFGLGEAALEGRCQNFPAHLHVENLYIARGKVCFSHVMRCHDEDFDLVISPGMVDLIADQFQDNKRLRRNTPETRVVTGRRVCDPVYVRLSKDRPTDI